MASRWCARNSSSARAMKTRGPSFDRMEPVATGVGRILDYVVESAPAHHPPQPADPHPQRLAIKRLRALLRAVRPALAAETARELDAGLQRAAHLLAPFREQAAATETLRALGRTEAPSVDLSPEAAAALEGAMREAEREMDSMRQRLRELLPAGQGWKLIGAGIVRTHQQANRRRKAAHSQGTEEAFHRWRVRVKQLGYQLEWVEQIAPHWLGKMGEQLRQLGQMLGSKHDLDLLAADAGAASSARERAGRESRRLQRAATALGAAIFRRSPDRFRRKLRRSWRHWRRS